MTEVNFEHINCKLCGSPDTVLFHDALNHQVDGLKDGKVYRCRHCDVFFIDPQFTKEEEFAFYQGNMDAERAKSRGCNSAEELDASLRPETLKRFNDLKPHLRSATQCNAVQRSATQCNAVQRSATQCNAVQRSNVRALEIGPGRGHWLQLMLEEANCRCDIVEYSEEYRKLTAKWYGNAYADLDEVPESGKYDDVFMFQLIEHLTDPIEYLKKIAKHLNPGGRVVLETSCAGDPLVSLYNVKPYKDWYFGQFHPFIYSQKALQWIFTEAGFADCRTWIFNRYDAVNHMNWLVTQKMRCRIPDIEKVFAPLSEMYEKQLLANGYGDTQYCIATWK